MFDALMARAVAAELEETLSRGRVQAVFGIDSQTIGFEVYTQHQRRYLVASIGGNLSRVHLATARLRSSGISPSPFLLLLRKYAQGAFINRVQALPRERILHIEFDNHAEGVSTLVAEIMGNRSNLILLDAEGIVLDSLKRVTPGMSRVRTVQPLQRYQAPPPQSKADPLATTSGELARRLGDRRGEQAWQVLVQSLAGISPLLARELVFRETGRTDTESAPEMGARLTSAVVEAWNSAPDPTIAFDGDVPAAVAAFYLTHLEPVEHFASPSAALEKFFGVVESYEGIKESTRLKLADARERLQRKRDSLTREMVSEEEVTRIRESGEMILTHASRIAQGQKTLRADREEGGPFLIRLDPDKTPVQNAKAYFAEYRHAKQAAASVPSRLGEVEAELEFADQVMNDLDLAETRAEIDTATAEARAAGLLAETKAKSTIKAAPSEPHSFTSPDGFLVLVGRNARQNERVTFELSSPDDVWLHARGVAGAHVIIRSNGQEVPSGTVEFAAGLAAFYSNARGENWADVIFAPRKAVSRAKQGRAKRPGLVTVRDERTIRVRPLEPEG